ncbi:MAG TPA: hypothetical protein GXX30_05070 [Firmicutes bacterium]|nr:hypothetical protein [Candidatus Fermentithermobacillaceae bacterium]
MAFPVARVGDTRIYMHITFLASALVLVASGYGLYLLVFASSLLIHEIGHLVAASLLGADVSKVEVWPFGAVGKLERAWQLEPQSEAIIAISGPVHSGILTAIASFIETVLAQKIPGGNVGAEFPLLHFLIRVNLGLAVANLMPCLPLDGGRFLRSQLALRLGYIEASRKVVCWGFWFGGACTGAGVLSLAWGLPWHWALLLGPLVIWGAIEEKDAAELQNVLTLLLRNERLLEKKAIPVEEILVNRDTRVKDVVSKLRPSRYHIFLVAEKDMSVCGKVSETKVLEAFYKGKVDLRIVDLCGDSPWP